MFPNTELLDALKALETAGAGTGQAADAPFQGPRELWRVGPTPNHAGAFRFWTVREAGRAAPGSDEPELFDGASREALALQPRPSSSCACAWYALVDMYLVFRKKNLRGRSFGPGGVCHPIRRVGHTGGEGVGACRWVLGEEKKPRVGVTVLQQGKQLP